MDVKDSAVGCLLGLACGEAQGRAAETGKLVAGDATAMALCSAAALRAARPSRLEDEVAQEGDIDAFMSAACSGLSAWAASPHGKNGSSLAALASCDALAAGRNWRETGAHGGQGAAPLALAIPIGPWLGLATTAKLVRFGQAVVLPLSGDESVGCASVGVATLSALATAKISVGTWANEVMMVVGGISHEVSAAIELAAELAATRAKPGDAMKAGVLGPGWLAHEALGCALFCCMSSPASIEGAMDLAARAGNPIGVSTLAGACMGAYLGLRAIPEAWLAFDGVETVRAEAMAFAEAIF